MSALNLSPFTAEHNASLDIYCLAYFKARAFEPELGLILTLTLIEFLFCSIEMQISSDGDEVFFCSRR